MGDFMRVFFLAFLTILLAACGNETSKEEQFIVHAFKVGKADSLLISQKDEYILIDAGEESDSI